eukprot:CAMPEP_0172445224 /NCGR_PEP_ID=MMETSP1065-20121228/5117_1 /TAXON_ID=265537 /ORGANISM="Amphiprora paludosa, Strain CCMP125" /LENGTH=353 /DNA_ID=CAMNT_0013196023 /DNA_START=274 /DNA_END=1332 /DNA_ORIENTATION=+
MTTSMIAASIMPSDKKNQMQGVPIFDDKQIQVHDLLGLGGFSAVYAMSLRKQTKRNRKAAPFLFRTTPQQQQKKHHEAEVEQNSSRLVTPNTTQSSLVEDSDAESLSSSDLRTAARLPLVPSDNARLAMKRLSVGAQTNARQHKIATQELYKEAVILTRLAPHQHANIITFYGISSCGLSAADSGTATSSSSPFLVLEQLTESLDRALVRWKKEEDESLKKSLFQSWKRPFGKNKNKTSCNQDADSTSLYQRLQERQSRHVQQVAVGLANALTFLHEEQGILYRDLKPSNIGFDAHGTVKLFDFSTARLMTQQSSKKPASAVGTCPYMAPENVDPQQDYGYPADVYSFGLVLW